jgi:hypothetical protein
MRKQSSYIQYNKGKRARDNKTYKTENEQIKSESDPHYFGELIIVHIRLK